MVGSFLAAGNANAAAEIAQLAVNDNRFVIIATLFLPAAGWVLFNIGTRSVTLHPRVLQHCNAPVRYHVKSSGVGLVLPQAYLLVQGEL